ncbi:MAG: valine--tRNA ligase [Eubacteriales bacterium]|nr:valine--tRNA ligase [Eubacteriales bacterium]
MARELEKNYNPAEMEERLYHKWENKGYFKAEVNRSKEPFTIVIPPPNVTGQLHMGHALDNTMQDVLIRFKRMQGYETLWQPGTDHAAIATEVKVVEKLAEEGLTKQMLGREGFMERAWEWKHEYGGRILEQLRKLGSSCDWDRERFTLDEGCTRAVNEAFCHYYDKGYIYQGYKLINWCPNCKTTISDAEVDHEEKDGFFWHIKYPFADGSGSIEIATTRPETMLGDTAVAVHPEDERYAGVIGKMVILPLVNKEIPIIADDYVEKDFGTGAVKITPAHDPNDYEVGLRHDLPQVNVMNDDGSINENGGKYQGLARYEARKQIVKDLEEGGYLLHIKPHRHNVGVHERCGEVIEPLLKEQWFLRMEELAKPAIEALKSGELKFVPERYGKIYLNWLENIRDWAISRQLWWGHRIPVYYCEDCGHKNVSAHPVEKCSNCGQSHLHQDEDSLDTWFSSALWPFETMGWPYKTEEMDYFFPTDVLVTGYDIIFFWVVRMVFSSLEFTGKLPFHTVLIHGLVRDDQGRKMSKSLGNGIDPLEEIEKYGADALRITLLTGNAPGNDMRYYKERVEASRNFANKIWNASRFILMNMPEEELSADFTLAPADKWILSKVNTLTKEVTENLDKYEMGIALGKLNDFLWEEFCDWYIEMVKPRLSSEDIKDKSAALWTLKTTLIQGLKLLHPFMPFITDEIFTYLQEEEDSIMVSEWPTYKSDWEFRAEEHAISVIKQAVVSIRNLRNEMKVSPKKKVKVMVVSEDAEVREIFNRNALFFGVLGMASEVEVATGENKVAEDWLSVVIPNAVIYMPFAELVDLEQEKQRLEKEIKKLLDEIDRIDKKLGNAGFVAKAPEKVVEEEKAKRENYQNMLKQAEESRARLG